MKGLAVAGAAALAVAGLAFPREAWARVDDDTLSVVVGVGALVALPAIYFGIAGLVKTVKKAVKRRPRPPAEVAGAPASSASAPASEPGVDGPACASPGASSWVHRALGAPLGARPGAAPPASLPAR